MVVAGIIGTIAGTVMICKKVPKVKEHVEQLKNDMVDVKEDVESGIVPAEDLNKITVSNYTATGLQCVKEMAPGVIVTAASVSSILAGHNITRQRNVALAAAYAAVNKGFKEYRNHVVERFGDEIDKELRFGVVEEQQESVVTDKKGKEKIVKSTEKVANPTYSPFARIYDDGCKGWSKDPETSKDFLLDQQRYANMKLKEEGVVWLNDVYKMLGFPMSKAGQEVGWVLDNPDGDGFIDFGIFNAQIRENADFVNGLERVIILDFNVDGYINDLI